MRVEQTDAYASELLHSEKFAKLSPAEKAVHESSIAGDRKTLRADSFIPATMAVIYLLILLYFKAIGGYKPVHIVPVAEQMTTKPPEPAAA